MQLVWHQTQPQTAFNPLLDSTTTNLRLDHVSAVLLNSCMYKKKKKHHSNVQKCQLGNYDIFWGRLSEQLLWQQFLWAEDFTYESALFTTTMFTVTEACKIISINIQIYNNSLRNTSGWSLSLF